MKVLNVYRSEPDATVKKLVEIVTRDRDADSFNLKRKLRITMHWSTRSLPPTRPSAGGNNLQHPIFLKNPLEYSLFKRIFF